MRKAICAVMIVLVLQSQVLGWGQLGHRVVASIAFRQLNATEQARIVEMLQAHPRYRRDFESRMPHAVETGSESLQNEWIFQQAAYWPTWHADIRAS